MAGEQVAVRRRNDDAKLIEAELVGHFNFIVLNRAAGPELFVRGIPVSTVETFWIIAVLLIIRSDAVGGVGDFDKFRAAAAAGIGNFDYILFPVFSESLRQRRRPVRSDLVGVFRQTTSLLVCPDSRVIFDRFAETVVFLAGTATLKRTLVGIGKANVHRLGRNRESGRLEFGIPLKNVVVHISARLANTLQHDRIVLDLRFRCIEKFSPAREMFRIKNVIDEAVP